MTIKQTIQMKIVPIEIGRWNEQVELWTRANDSDEWYPLTFAHIDTFHTRTKQDVYELLNDGETVELEVTMEVFHSGGGGGFE